METGLTISKGIGWSPDNTIMYLTDTPLHTIYAYDFDPATGRGNYVRCEQQNRSSDIWHSIVH
jgi:sugar lactone lactonase YvrE